MSEQEIEKSDKRIDDFLRKKMTPEEEIQFMSDLKTNKEFAHRARMTALLIKEIRKIGKENNQKIMTFLEEMVSEDDNK